MAAASGGAVQRAEEYYDSGDADAFYRHIWGGEDIHIGLYEGPRDPIVEASRRTVEHMAARVPELGARTRVLDIGAGYGGAARLLARAHGCRVTCLNLSETQNAYNRERNRDEGLEARVEVRHGNFEAIPAADAAFDLVWSQDAILHSGDRGRVLAEVARVLAPGGHFVFTDPMQSDDCPPGVLQPVYERIHLDSLGSPAWYRRAGEAAGLAWVGFEDLTPQLGRHYARVREELARRRDEITRHASPAYVDRMLEGLQNWVEAAEKGYLAWGILHFRRP